MKDHVGNDLKEGLFVAVELDSKIVKGHIHQIVEGGVSMLTAPGQPDQLTPTTIVIMCPVTVTIHPQIPRVSNIMALKQPETQPASQIPQ